MSKKATKLDADGSVLRRCHQCTQWLPQTSDNFRYREDRHVWEGPCRPCRNEYNREYYAENPIRPEDTWAAQIKYRYGITGDQYYELLAIQGGVCAVCGSPPTTQKLSVDHCHDTGRVRGLLCYKCNTAAGLLGDDPSLAAQLTLYLER